jgi:hypothetical protein
MVRVYSTLNPGHHTRANIYNCFGKKGNSAATGKYPNLKELRTYNELVTKFARNPIATRDELLQFCETASSKAYLTWINWALLSSETITPQTFIIINYVRPRSIYLKEKSFGVFNSYNEYCAWLSKIPLKDRTFNEYRLDRPHNFYLDIDGGGVNRVAERRRYDIGQDILNAIRTAFKKDYAITLEDKSIVICDSSDKTKYSQHIVIKDYHVANARESGRLARSVASHISGGGIVEGLPPRVRDLLDIGATSKTNGALRLVGNRKKDSKRVKKIVSGHKDIDTLISRATGELLPERVDYSKDGEERDAGSRYSNFTSYDTPVLEEIDMNIKKKLGDCYEPVERLRTDAFGLIARRLYPGECKLCKKEHEQAGLIIERIGRKFIARCSRKNNYRRDDMIESMEVGKLPYSESQVIVDNLIPTYTHDDKWDDYRDPNIVPDLPNATKTNEREMPNLTFDDEMNTLVIRSPVGTGKTKALIRYINAHPDDRVVILSFRVSFSIEMRFKLKEAGIETVLYKNIKGDIDLRKHKRLIIQLNSLHRITLMKREHDWLPHLLVLDESESILSQFDHGALRPRLVAIKNAFEILMKESRRIVCMDACTGPRTIKLIKLSRDQKCVKWIDNIHPSGRDKTYTLLEPEHLTRMITLQLEQGFKIVCCSNTKVFIEGLKRRVLDAKIGIEEKDIGVYTGDTLAETKKELKDVNTNWLKYKLLLYTSTVQAGISFEKLHYDCLFGHFTHRSCDFRACFQMLGRVREVTSKNIFISFSEDCLQRDVMWRKRDIELYIENKYSKARGRAIAKAKAMTRELNEQALTIGFGFKEFDDDIAHIDGRYDIDTGRYEVLNKDLYYHIKVGNMSEKSYGSNHFVYSFFELIRSQGSSFMTVKPGLGVIDKDNVYDGWSMTLLTPDQLDSLRLRMALHNFREPEYKRELEDEAAAELKAQTQDELDAKREATTEIEDDLNPLHTDDTLKRAESIEYQKLLKHERTITTATDYIPATRITELRLEAKIKTKTEAKTKARVKVKYDDEMVKNGYTERMIDGDRHLVIGELKDDEELETSTAWTKDGHLVIDYMGLCRSERAKFREAKKKNKELRSSAIAGAETVKEETYQLRKREIPVDKKELLENIKFRLMRDYAVNECVVTPKFVKTYDNIRSRVLYSNLKVLNDKSNLREAVNSYRDACDEKKLTDQLVAIDATRDKSTMMVIATDTLEAAGFDTSIPLHELAGVGIARDVLERNLNTNLLKTLEGRREDLLMLFKMRKNRLLTAKNSSFRKTLSYTQAIISKVFGITMKCEGKSMKGAYTISFSNHFMYNSTSNEWIPSMAYNLDVPDDIYKYITGDETSSSDATKHVVDLDIPPPLDLDRIHAPAPTPTPTPVPTQSLNIPDEVYERINAIKDK